MVTTTERPITFDPTGKKHGIPKPGTTGSVDMLKLLPGRLPELYSGNGCLIDPDHEAFNRTRKSLLVNERDYAQLIKTSYMTQEW